MRSWEARTAVLAAFAAGVSLAPWIAAPWWIALPALAVAASLLRLPRLRLALPLLASIVGLAAGGARLHPPAPDWLTQSVSRAQGPTYVWVRGKAVEGEPWPDGSRVTLQLDSARLESAWLPVHSLVRAYLPVPPPAEGALLEASLGLTAPRSASNPGQFDSAAYLANQGIALVGTCRSSALVHESPPRKWHLIGRYRRAIRSRLEEDTGDLRGALLALLLGERGLLDTQSTADLSRSGLLHLIALSGFNVGLVLLLFMGLAHALRCPPSWRDAAGLALLGVYGLLVAPSSSLSRALLMAALFLLLRLLARPHSALTAWTLAAALLLLYRPQFISDAGFQLTFAATLGILVFWSAYPAALPAKGPLGWLLKLLWVGLSAQVATLPILVITFHRFSPWGWLATPAASLPLMAVQGIGLLYILGLGFVPGLHQALAWSLELTTRPFMAMAEGLGRSAWGSFFVPFPWWGWTALYLLGLALLAWPSRRRASGWVLMGAAVVAFWSWPTGPAVRDARGVALLDVGEASCQTVLWPGGCLLVDAGTSGIEGPGSGITVIEPFLARAGVKGLTGIVLTHWDRDHCGAAEDLIQDLPVGFLAYPATDPPKGDLPLRIAAMAERRNVALLPLVRGDELRFSEPALSVLGPTLPSCLRNENDRSLVARLRLGTAGLIVTGDLEKGGERELLDAGLPLVSYALMAPHHGSATSSSPAWLDAVAPKVILISVGRANRFGHPSPAVLARYASLPARVYRTDRDGALLLDLTEGRPGVYRHGDGDWSRRLFRRLGS
ncbi:MAG: DNA internalization-related competence protein ComEC/Rec2 [Acidobacteriota bacterium]